jgi:hypothetical protein
VADAPSIVELLERLAVVEASFAGACARVEALIAENQRLAEENA